MVLSATQHKWTLPPNTGWYSISQPEGIEDWDDLGGYCVYQDVLPAHRRSPIEVQTPQSATGESMSRIGDCKSDALTITGALRIPLAIHYMHEGDISDQHSAVCLQ